MFSNQSCRKFGGSVPLLDLPGRTLSKLDHWASIAASQWNNEVEFSTII